MQIAGMLLGCVLLGQAPGAVTMPPQGIELPRTFDPPAAADAIRAGTPTATASPPHRTQPPDMVANALQLPRDSTVVGQPLALAAAIGSTADRQQQLEIVKSYWRLSQAVAEYHFSLDHARAMELAKGFGGGDATMRLARAAATAQLREAELEAVRAQHDLAILVRLPPDAPLPLPADRPHVGGYRTAFNELFAGRTPPESARLAERLLPLQRQAIDQQAAAVQAAEDALAAVSEDYRAGRAVAAAVASANDDLLHQQRAFIRSVCSYNGRIADYGLTVARPAASQQELVAMLIAPTEQAATIASGDGQPAQPVSGTEPIGGDPFRQPATQPPTAPPIQNQPTPAPPRDSWHHNEPTPAPPRDHLYPSGNQPHLAPPRDAASVKSAPTPDLPRPQLVNKPPQPPLAPGDAIQKSALPSGEGIQKSPLPPGEGQGVRASARDRSQGDGTRSVPATISPLPPGEGQGEGRPRGNGSLSTATLAPLYPALIDIDPAARAKQLAQAVYWDRSLPDKAGKPISLTEVLLRNANSDRRAAIDAYWLLRQRSAEYQLMVQQAELLGELGPIVLDRRGEPCGPSDMLRLHAAQLAAKAATREAQAALVEAQYAVALRIGAVADEFWPLASTLPHCGGYQLKLDAQSRNFAESWSIRRLVATIPLLADRAQQRAAAVVEADAARVAAAEQYRAGTATVERVLQGVADETEQTAAFFSGLTEYNEAIAEYALNVMPSTTPADKLAAALVMTP